MTLRDRYEQAKEGPMVMREHQPDPNARWLAAACVLGIILVCATFYLYSQVAG